MERAVATDSSPQPTRAETPVTAPAVAVYERPTLVTMIREAWRDRGLVPRLGVQTIAKGSSGTKLGGWWWVLAPILQIFGMALLFGGILRVPSGPVPYLVFLLAGMSTWTLFDRTVWWSTRSFGRVRKLLTIFRIPLLVVPFSGVMMGGLFFVVQFGILAAVLLYYWVAKGTLYLQIGPELLVALAGLALALVTAWALALWLSVLNARARDTQMVLRFVLRVWVVITPVIYLPSSLPGALEFLATVNPLAPIVAMVKYGLLGIGHVSLDGVAVSVGFALVVFAGGLVFFHRMSHGLLTARIEAAEDDEEL